jgi:hypothetical protein
MITELNRAEIKKHLNKGDLTKIAADFNVSRTTVSLVFRGERNNIRILEAIIEKAEQNKAITEKLAIRTQKL